MRYSTLNTLCLGVENSIINRLPPSFKIRWHSDNPLTIFSKFLIPNEIVTTSKVLLESDKFSASSHKSLMLGLILKCSIFCCATFSISSDKSIPTIWEVGIFCHAYGYITCSSSYINNVSRFSFGNKFH